MFYHVTGIWILDININCVRWKTNDVLEMFGNGKKMVL